MGHRQIKFNQPAGDALTISSIRLMAVLKRLPTSAYLVAIHTETHDNGTFSLVLGFESYEWRGPDLGEETPMLPSEVSLAELIEATDFAKGNRRSEQPAAPKTDTRDRVEWEQCYCQLEYTGERFHRSECPMNRKALRRG